MRGQKTMRRHRRWASTSHGETPQEKPPANVNLAGKLYGKKMAVFAKVWLQALGVYF